VSRPPPLRRVSNSGDGEQAHGCGGHGHLHGPSDPITFDVD
jgi:hypothetical protein